MATRRIVATAVACVACAASLIAPLAASASTPDTDSSPAFVATIEPLTDSLAAELTGVSWHDGCPVALADLRLVTMPHLGFDGAVHEGELVVHAAVAGDVATVFGGLLARGFPIARMERVESFAGDDDASMAADNTSAFNCREITGGGAFSIHSWGMAIDVNPVRNPYVKGTTVLPTDGLAFLDRTDIRPGMIIADDAVVAAFAAAGFEWGGSWTRLQDYQHFEIPEPEAVAASYVAPPGSQGAAAVAPCSAGTPDSAAWSGELWSYVDTADGSIDVAEFNEFLAGQPAGVAGPCDAARVLLHLDRPDPQATAVVVDTQPVAGGAVVTVTLDGLLDDSVAAVRYIFEMTALPVAPVQITTGSWSQRCQPGRGHEDFSTELCV